MLFLSKNVLHYFFGRCRTCGIFPFLNLPARRQKKESCICRIKIIRKWVLPANLCTHPPILSRPRISPALQV